MLWQLIRIKVWLLTVVLFLISLPQNESQYELSFCLELIAHYPEKHLILELSSVTQLPYELQLDSHKAVISLKPIDPNELILPDSLPEELDYDYLFDDHNNQLQLEFSLKHFPFFHIFSCPSHQKHQIHFRKTPYRILNSLSIVVDPGHGAFDEETSSIYDPGSIREEFVESEINLQLALKLKELMEERGAKVVLTREKEDCKYNLRLFQRFELVNAFQPDLFLSLHQNESDYSYANGVFIYYRNPEAIPLARSIIHSMSRNTGLKTNHLLNDPLITLQSIETKKALLLECTFLSSPIDRAKLQEADFITRLASSINQGIVEYFENLYFRVE